MLISGHCRFLVVHLPNDVPDVLVFDVLDDNNRVRVLILHQHVLEPRRAGRQNRL